MLLNYSFGAQPLWKIQGFVKEECMNGMTDKMWGAFSERALDAQKKLCMACTESQPYIT